MTNVYLKYNVSSEAPIKLGQWLSDTKATFSIGDKEFSIDLIMDDWEIEPLTNGG